MTTLWSAEINDEMVAHLSDDDIGELVEALADAVVNICESYKVE